MDLTTGIKSTFNITMKNEGVVLADGGWYSKRDCPNTPVKCKQVNSHSFKDFSSRPSRRANIGESLVTSKCTYCGGIIKDCPTIDVF